MKNSMFYKIVLLAAIMLTCIVCFTFAQATGVKPKMIPADQVDVIKHQADSLNAVAVQLAAEKDTLTKVAETHKKEFQEFKELLFGGIDYVDYIAGFIFAFIGMFIRWFYTTVKAVKKNPSTPDKFSLMYWIKDNLAVKILNIIATLCVLFVSMRFAYELGGWTLTMFYALIVGLCFDYFLSLILNLKPAKKDISIPDSGKPADSVSTPN